MVTDSVAAVTAAVYATGDDEIKDATQGHLFNNVVLKCPRLTLYRGWMRLTRLVASGDG